MEINDDQMFFSNGKRYVSASSDVSKTVRDLVRVAAEAVGSNMGALFLLDENNTALKPAVMVNLPEEYVSGCGDIPLGQQCCGRAALHKMPWHVEDIWNSALFSDEIREAAKRASVRACFSVPVLTADNTCIGSLSSHFSETYIPSNYELDRHRLFAELIAFALCPSAESRNLIEGIVAGTLEPAS
jgi:GAF domain-containing protein